VVVVDRRRETFEQLREVLQRRRGLAALVFISVFVAMGTASLSLPPLFRATSVLVVEPTRSGTDLPGEVLTRLEGIHHRLLSRTEILDRVRRFDLYPELTARALDGAVVEQMKSDVRMTTKASADPGERGTVVAVSLSYRGRDPETAALVCNSLAAFYVDEDARLRSRRYAGRADMLKQRLAELKQRLDDQERRFGDVRSAPGGPADRGGADMATFERLSSRLRVVRDERMRTLERREALLKRLAEADPRDAVSARLMRLRGELTERRLRLTDKHPDVLQLEAEIAGLEREPAAAPAAAAPDTAAVSHLREALRDIEAELPTMKREEAQLSEEIASRQTRRGTTSSGRPSTGEASHDYRAVQEMYGALMRRYEDAQLADSAEETLGSRLALLDSAVPPTRPSGPHRLRLLLFTLLASLAAAGAVVGVAERLDDSFRTLDDLRAFTNVPVLATVAALATPADQRRRRRRLGASVAVAAVTMTLVALATHHVVAKGHALTSALERAR
jgi:polysaccharide biosynthesis transport protein